MDLESAALRAEQEVESKLEALTNDILDLVRIPSVYGVASETRKALLWTAQKAESMGFAVQWTREGDVVVADLGEGPETLGILVHVDVVAAGDLAKWTRPPFEPEVREGRIYGRGTEDDKGPVVASLYAMNTLRTHGLAPGKRVRLIVGSCEEGTWTDMDHFLAQFGAPDYGYSPDGEFPVFNIESGYADITLNFHEPRRALLETILAGESTNTIPSRAELKFCGQSARVCEGVACHSSLPELGDNAILKLCGDLDPDLDGFHFSRFARDFLMGEPYGAALGIDDGTPYYQGLFVDRGTVAPTTLRLTEDGVAMNLNLRPRAGVSREDVFGAFLRLAENYAFDIFPGDYWDPLMVSPDLPFLGRMNQAAERFGVAPGFRTSRGTTYAKAMKGFVSWGPNLPGEDSVAHKEDEYLALQTLALSTKIYTAFLLTECGA
jgi:succinyl-diaminopimelate desuccinylase